LQEDLSIDGYSQEKFFEYTRNFYEEITNSGGETVLYMPWEYDNGNAMTIEEIAEDYKSIGDELGIKVAPVGLAWDKAISERPELNLYGGDRAHASMSGNYLTIAVLYATIFEQSPEGLPYMPTDLLNVGEDTPLYMEWKMSEEDIAFLQRIAWETVSDYFGFE
jgi:hypothetical protein